MNIADELRKLADQIEGTSLNTVEEKNIVAAAVKSAQLVKAVIDTPLLSEDGLLTKEIRDLQNDQEVNKALSTSPIWSKTK